MGAIRKRIDELIKKLGVNPYVFEKAIGRSNSYLRNVKSISAEVCANIVEVYPSVSLDWLILGVGNMFKDSDKSCPQTPTKVIQNNNDKVEQAIGNVEGSVASPQSEKSEERIEEKVDEVIEIHSPEDLHKIEILTIKVDTLTAENKKQEDSIADLRETIKDLRERIAELKDKNK